MEEQKSEWEVDGEIMRGMGVTWEMVTGRVCLRRWLCGVNIASSMNHQNFNSEVEGVSVAMNKKAFVHVFGRNQ